MASDLVAVETQLWAAADQLWANTGLRPADFSEPVLGLIFLRYADKRFHETHAALLTKGFDEDDLEPTDYQAEGVMFLPESARFAHLLQLTEGDNVGKALNEAMLLVEGGNAELKGILPRSYNRLPNATLVEILRLLAPLEMGGDAFGKVYEFFLGSFARAEGSKGGVFYTPESIVKLIVEIIQPFHGRIFDPACGSGGMFVHSANFVQRHKKNPSSELTVYGTEKDAKTVKLAKMNLAVHGLSGDIREANAYYDDPHNALSRFDFVMANPPFNVSAVDWDRLREDRRLPYGLPVADNANFHWIQVFLSSLNETGRAGFVMHNSAADSEALIRQQIIDQEVVDVVLLTSPNLFYTVSLPCTLWFFDKGKRGGKRAGQILFIDARKVFKQVDTAIREVTEEQIERIASTIRSYRGEPGAAPYEDVRGFCRRVGISDVRGKSYSLNPKLYIENAARAGDESTTEEAKENVNNGLLDVEARSSTAFAQLGRALPLDRSILLSYATLMNVGKFRGWQEGPPLRGMFSDYIGGTWGRRPPDFE